MDLLKALVVGIIWYFCHKYIRKGLNPRVKWNEGSEVDAQLGGFAALCANLLKDIIV